RMGLPDLLFIFPTRVRVHDRRTSMVTTYRLDWSDDKGLLPPLSGNPLFMEASVGVGTPATAATLGFTPEEYMEAVRRVRQYIHDGDVYQVNLSQRFRFPFPGDAFSLWQALFEANPAPFYAWIDAGTFQVLSASMERFVLVDGDRIETRPIKGTRPRGKDDEEDRRLENELRHSAKDDAELSMIVDLERNDLGRICLPGSVRVAGHKRIERYANVMHLVSEVEGRLRPGTGFAAIFRALFPGGSVTGCPKIRAMEIIDGLEPETRHVYTGAIGYVANDGRMDFNIAIRTAVAVDGICHLSVGGGVVYDSDPREEYLETLDKGRTFFELAGVRLDSNQRNDANQGMDSILRFDSNERD
ncbi:MAG: aminodeoxychorismate synthase component I, partial [Bacteroidetes bacterium]|nr:aminodeoxychorismate synthase component I [Bacteroidota bacterium]